MTENEVIVVIFVSENLNHFINLFLSFLKHFGDSRREKYLSDAGLGKIRIISLPSKASRASLLTRCNSLFTKIEALFSSILFSLMSIQYQIRPSISPIRREQEKAKLIAKDNVSSSHTSSACSNVSAV